jgi:hypothetical protein
MVNMRAIIIAAVCVLFPAAALAESTSSPPMPPSAPTAGTIVVQRHVVIPILLAKDVRVGGAGNANEEKKVKFEVAQDVIYAGFIIAKKGDLAEGHYTTQKNVTKRYFSTDVSQEVALDVDDVVNFCGDTIHMEFERTFVGGVRGGIFSFGAHAHDAVFSKGTVLEAESDRLEKSVCAEKTTLAALPLPEAIVLPDGDVAPAK